MTTRCNYNIGIPEEEISKRKEELKFLESCPPEGKNSTEDKKILQIKKTNNFSDKELIKIYKTRNSSSRSYYLYYNVLTYADKIKLTHLQCLNPELFSQSCKEGKS